jgi:polyhydroxyalkanoate synthesis regulator phasin
MPENTTLDAAVKDAVSTEASNANTTDTTGKEASETTTEAKETPKVEETPVVDTETQEALQLYRALKDPTIGKAVVQELANRAGVAVNKGEVTQTQAKKAVIDLLKENVPSEYHFLVEGMAKGIEAAINQNVNDKVAPIQQQSQQALERMVEKEVDSEIESFYARNKDAVKFKGEIDKLSGKMPWGGPDSMPMKEYLDHLYTIVSKEESENKTVERVVGRINKNAKEVRETSTVASPTDVKVGSKLPSLDEAIRAGFRNERLI